MVWSSQCLIQGIVRFGVCLYSIGSKDSVYALSEVSDICVVTRPYTSLLSLCLRSSLGRWPLDLEARSMARDG